MSAETAADGIPEAFARYLHATFPAELGDFAQHETAMRWKHLTGPAEREFWRSIDAAQQPQPAPELAATVAELRKLHDRHKALHERIAAVAYGLEQRADINRPSKVTSICDGIAAALRNTLDPR